MLPTVVKTLDYPNHNKSEILKVWAESYKKQQEISSHFPRMNLYNVPYQPGSST